MSTNVKWMIRYFWFQVSVHEAAFMHERDAFQYLMGDRLCFIFRERRNQIATRVSIGEILHANPVELAIFVPTKGSNEAVPILPSVSKGHASIEQ
jgi:hypothetical protein